MRRYFSDLGTGFVSLIKGMVITFKNIFSPIITLQYPKEKQAMTPRYRGLVDLRRRIASSATSASRSVRPDAWP